ncbi:hypothetical protein LEMLEM_LOCUS1156 [Lemmus lemmus]
MPGPAWKQCGRTAFRGKGPGKPEATAESSSIKKPETG